MTDRTPRTWRTSSHSGENGNCVQLSITPTTTAIRDSKNTTPELVFPPMTWQTFLTTTRES